MRGPVDGKSLRADIRGRGFLLNQAGRVLAAGRPGDWMVRVADEAFDPIQKAVRYQAFPFPVSGN